MRLNVSLRFGFMLPAQLKLHDLMKHVSVEVSKNQYLRV